VALTLQGRLFKMYQNIALLVFASSALLAVGFQYNMAQRVSITRLAADEDQTIKDLNLTEMFEVFEEADKKIPDAPSPPSKPMTNGGSGKVAKAVEPVMFNPAELPGVSMPMGYFGEFLQIKRIETNACMYQNAVTQNL
jgi:hypothetical protein